MKLVCSTASCGAHCCALLKRCHAKNFSPAQQTGLPSTVDVCLISGQGHGARRRNFCVLRKGPHRRACNLFGQQNTFAGSCRACNLPVRLVALVRHRHCLHKAQLRNDCELALCAGNGDDGPVHCLNSSDLQLKVRDRIGMNSLGRQGLHLHFEFPGFGTASGHLA